MQVKLLAAVVAAGEGEKINVSQVCSEAGASRKTFYKWVKRYREHGMEGLEDRSTRPLSSPNQISGEVEDLIGMAIYLLAPASDFCTGQVMYVDGGYTAG